MAHLPKDKQSKINLASRMDKGTVWDVSDIKSIMDKYRINVNARNQFGESPLMMACATGDREMVKFLLDRGARPNARSKNGNTPMHFSILNWDSYRRCRCLREGKCVFDRVQYYAPSQTQTRQTFQRMSILRLLIKHGATLKYNSSGLNPSCLAAMHQRSETVEFFASRNKRISKLVLSDDRRARAYEIIGVTIAFSRSFFYLFKMFNPRDGKSYKFLHKALCIRKKSAKTIQQPSVLADAFSLFSTRECRRPKDLQRITQDLWALQVQCLLIANRVLPKEIKSDYVFPNLLNHAYYGLFNTQGNEKKLSQGAKIFKEAITVELQSGTLKFGSVLRMILEAFRCDNDEPWPIRNARQECFEMLSMYSEAFDEIPEHQMNEGLEAKSPIPHLLEELGSTLIFVATNRECKSRNAFESLLQFGERMTTVYRKKCRGKVPSVTHSILADIMRLYLDLEDYVIHGHRVKLAIARIVKCEDATEMKNKYSLLHMLVREVLSVHDLPFVKDVARILIRHGCKIGALDRYCRTAREILCDVVTFDADAPENRELMALLSPPTSVLSLEEMAARTILRHKVPYEGILPKLLSDTVNGELQLNSELLGFASDLSDSDLDINEM